ncbi:MAG: class I SAM-dependent methyltransferase [Thermomicrobiales bacterium]
MQETAREIDWAKWLRRWDAQQEGYLPDREERFGVMLDVLDALMSDEFVAIDLAAGPGSISQRLLGRFPRARSLAVDLDPVLMTMGQAVLGDMDGRLRWVEADLNGDEWPAALGVERVDAVLSTTALHWLPPGGLNPLARRLASIVRPGGVFLDGDHMGFPPHLATFGRVSSALNERRWGTAFAAPGAEDWDDWWSAFGQESGTGDLIEERTRRFAWSTHDADATAPILEVYEAALRDAGFREVGVIWQKLDNRVLMAVR